MTDKNTEFDRRVFMAGAVGAAATLGALGAAEAQPPAGGPPGGRLPAGRRGRPTRRCRRCSGSSDGSIVSRPTSTIAR